MEDSIKEPVEEEVVKSPEVVPEPVTVDPDFVDRSNYDCEACGGDGLVKNGFNVDVLCPQCQGKGHTR